MEEFKGLKQFFTRRLMQWHYNENSRSLPWKGEKDPYKIWLSEVILQQTRAQQGLPYYEKFISEYPTIKKMAAADEELIFRLWQGLGYYNRCRNMLATAKYISSELKGQFPATYEGLLDLKGIGPYTAAAIASFAFGLPYAVVDGNVYRVLSRYFNMPVYYDTPAGKKEFQQLAQELLDEQDSASFNQAIMDLGATVCTPQNPQCSICPLSAKCKAYELGIQSELPVKSKRITVKNRYFHYLIFNTGDKVWIEKRIGKDIWQNLHQPYLLEHNSHLSQEEVTELEVVKRSTTDAKGIVFEGALKQKLTHQLIESHFYTIRVKEQFDVANGNGKWININELKKYAFPRSLVSFFEKKLYF